MLESSLWEEIQRYYHGKFLSMVESKGMFFLRKRWCCATGAKLGTCFYLSRVILLRRIRLVYNLICRKQSLSRHLLLLRRRLGREIVLQGGF